MCIQLFNPAAIGDGNVNGVIIKLFFFLKSKVSVPAFVLYENNSSLLWTVRLTLRPKPV